MQKDLFLNRHIGPNPEAEQHMLNGLGISSTEQLIDETVPESIRLSQPLNVPAAISEQEYAKHIQDLADKNKLFRSFIGQGYYSTYTPAVIQRNVFENPGWYTQYTPYQAEIAQGRLEALLNFQTMVSSLTGLPIANASLLDEGSAAAEAMIMGFNKVSRKSKHKTKFFVDANTLSQTIDVLKTRAYPLGIELIIDSVESFSDDEDVFGMLLSYPDAQGEIHDWSDWINDRRDAQDYFIVMATDLLALTLLKSPGSMGVDCAIGNSQRFGVPLGYGGPHAAFFACTEGFKRSIPGRIIGVSKDRYGNTALRMALQTREQHIRRDKATSNICTAQALLAVMASCYAVYHGPEGLQGIAQDIHSKTQRLHAGLCQAGYNVLNNYFFDTLSIALPQDKLSALRARAESDHINLFFTADEVRLSLDECTTEEELQHLGKVFECAIPEQQPQLNLPWRSDAILDHEVFHQYRSETSMMRYLKRLENKDLSLMHSMIALGSCTMKLNAAIELQAVSLPAFNQVHPFVPSDQVGGYHQLIDHLAAYLNEITGFDATSFQPNSGAQGEYAGLLSIQAYHRANGQPNRNIVLIPESAHGTNPASAVMAGCQVVVIRCADNGDIDLDHLEEQATLHAENLSSLMITYPSTHGVFERGVQKACAIIHNHGGQVYMDGANMNAQVGLTNPAKIGADVCHLNLHKTFAIPHGGGGPGVGPICVKAHLAPHLPGHVHFDVKGQESAVSAAPFGSASILLISYAYIRLLGHNGLKRSTEIAILNANYIKHRLEAHYKVLYTDEIHGHVAHELIIDFRPFKALGIEVEDIAKRLIDYGFHAPTMSWPVVGTMMIEPTESETKEEIDAFCDALIAIKQEIDEIASGTMEVQHSMLKNAPHTIAELTSDIWQHDYSRQEAAWPMKDYSRKFWPSVGRVDNSFGDRNLVCTCPPMEDYMT
ncbi:MAG: aminomethyl-transferring glycine dehydrogenase [Chitinophagales bacterium]